MAYLFVLQVLLANYFSANNTDTKHFLVLHKGKTVGELSATRTIDGDMTHYHNITTIDVKIVSDMQIKFSVQSTYKGRYFESSKVVITKNGKPYTTSATKRVGNGYQFYKDGSLSATIKGNIVYSAARMLYDEPKGILNAYSEENGVFDPIARNKNGTYEKRNSRGKHSIYRYQNSSLCSMSMDLGLTDVEMVLK